MCFLTYGSFSPGFVRLDFIFYLSSVFSLILANKIKEKKKETMKEETFKCFQSAKMRRSKLNQWC